MLGELHEWKMYTGKNVQLAIDKLAILSIHFSVFGIFITYYFLQNITIKAASIVEPLGFSGSLPIMLSEWLLYRQDSTIVSVVPVPSRGQRSWQRYSNVKVPS